MDDFFFSFFLFFFLSILSMMIITSVLSPKNQGFRRSSKLQNSVSDRIGSVWMSRKSPEPMTTTKSPPQIPERTNQPAKHRLSRFHNIKRTEQKKKKISSQTAQTQRDSSVNVTRRIPDPPPESEIRKLKFDLEMYQPTCVRDRRPWTSPRDDSSPAETPISGAAGETTAGSEPSRLASPTRLPRRQYGPASSSSPISAC